MSRGLFPERSTILRITCPVLRGLLPRRLLNARHCGTWNCHWGFCPRGYQVMWEWGCIPGLWPRLSAHKSKAYFGRPRGFFPGRLLGLFALGRSARNVLIGIGRPARKYSASGPAFGVTFTRATLWKIKFLIFDGGSKRPRTPDP